MHLVSRERVYTEYIILSFRSHNIKTYNFVLTSIDTKSYQSLVTH